MFNIVEGFPKVVNIDFNKNKYNLELRGRITQLDGNSGSGKTLLCDIIDNIKSDMKYNNEKYPDYFNNIFTFNYMIKYNGVSDLKDLSNSLIVFDRADNVSSDKDLINYVLSDKNNCYLFIARTCLDLGLSPNYICELGNRNGVLVTLYEFEEKGWF